MRPLPPLEPIPGWVVIYAAVVLLLSIVLCIYLDRRDNAKADAESWQRYLAGHGDQQ